MPGANSSFDCYEPQKSKRIQVKACSVEEDLTSFGPDSVWDEIYFVHFYPNKKYDGSYNYGLLLSMRVG
jgi:Bsp6I restriction endonuclease